MRLKHHSVFQSETGGDRLFPSRVSSFSGWWHLAWGTETALWPEEGTRPVPKLRPLL